MTRFPMRATLFIATILLAALAAAQEVRAQEERVQDVRDVMQLEPFPLAQVRLLEGRWNNEMQRDRTYLRDLPQELTRGKNEVTVRFLANHNTIAGGVFGCATLRCE